MALANPITATFDITTSTGISSFTSTFLTPTGPIKILALSLQNSTGSFAATAGVVRAKIIDTFDGSIILNLLSNFPTSAPGTQPIAASPGGFYYITSSPLQIAITSSVNWTACTHYITITYLVL